MNRWLSQDWISRLAVPDSLTWVSLAMLASPGGLLDEHDLAADPGSASLGEVFGLPVVDPAEARADWEARGHRLAGAPETGDWSVLLEHAAGRALLVPQEADPVPRLLLFTQPDDYDGLRLAVLEVEMAW
jgi:hypothetical protein